MAYEQKITVILPPATLAYTYLYVPDTEAPEGAAFKPDNKFKATAVFSHRSHLAKAEATILAALKAKFPHVPEAEFILPIRDHDGEDKKEDFRGKTSIKASSKFRPKLVDTNRTVISTADDDVLTSSGKRERQDSDVRSGDVCRLSTTVYLYSKTEKERVGGKLVDVATYGASLQLNGVMVVEKNGGGSDDGFDDEYAGGYVAPVKREVKRSEHRKAVEPTGEDNVNSDGDF